MRSLKLLSLVVPAVMLFGSACLAADELPKISQDPTQSAFKSTLSTSPAVVLEVGYNDDECERCAGVESVLLSLKAAHPELQFRKYWQWGLTKPEIVIVLPGEDTRPIYIDSKTRPTAAGLEKAFRLLKPVMDLYAKQEAVSKQLTARREALQRDLETDPAVVAGRKALADVLAQSGLSKETAAKLRRNNTDDYPTWAEIALGEQFSDFYHDLHHVLMPYQLEYQEARDTLTRAVEPHWRLLAQNDKDSIAAGGTYYEPLEQARDAVVKAVTTP